MKILSLFALVIGVGLSGCSQEQSTPPAADTKAPDAAKTATEAKPTTPAAPAPTTNAPTPPAAK